MNFVVTLEPAHFFVFHLRRHPLRRHTVDNVRAVTFTKLTVLLYVVVEWMRNRLAVLQNEGLFGSRSSASFWLYLTFPFFVVVVLTVGNQSALTFHRLVP